MLLTSETLRNLETQLSLVIARGKNENMLKVRFFMFLFVFYMFLEDIKGKCCYTETI